MFLSKKVATLNKAKPDVVKPKRMLGGIPYTIQDGMTKRRRSPCPKSPFPKIHPPPSTCSITHPSKLPPKAFPQSMPQSLPLQPVYNSTGIPSTTALTCTSLPIQPHRKNLVEYIVNPSDIRIKQSDSIQDFLKEVRFLNAGVVGSLLLSKLEVNYPFELKAKALYAVEFQRKKNVDYL
jgi:hypothetical protein